MTRTLVFALFALVLGCDVSPATSFVPMPTARFGAACTESDYTTVRNGARWTCRLLACQYGSSGSVAPLWCDPAPGSVTIGLAAEPSPPPTTKRYTIGSSRSVVHILRNDNHQLVVELTPVDGGAP